MTPTNVPFTKVDLASHDLQMCLLMWQDQFNLHKKGMTPVEICPLLTSLQAIEHVCLQETSNALSGEKASNMSKKGNKRPGTESTTRVSRKVHYEKHCNLCKKHGDMHTTHNMKDCHKYEKDRLEIANFHTTKKGGKKPYPAKQSFAQLSKKLGKHEKVIKKLSIKSKKCCRDDSDLDSE